MFGCTRSLIQTSTPIRQAYNHSREARRLLKKEAAAQRSVRGSMDKGSGGGGGPFGFTSPTPSDAQGVGAGEEGDPREIFASSRNSR